MTNLPHAHNLNYNTEYFGAVTGAERPQLSQILLISEIFSKVFRKKIKSSFLMTNEISEETPPP